MLMSSSLSSRKGMRKAQFALGAAVFLWCFGHVVASRPSSLGPGESSPGQLDTFFEKRRRGNLYGYDLKITVIEEEPFVTVRDSSGDIMTKSNWDGFIPKLIELVADRAGFTYSLYLPSGLGGGICSQPEGRQSLKNLTSSYGCGQRDTFENRTQMFFSLYYVTADRLNKTYATQPFLTNQGLSIISISQSSTDFSDYAFLFLQPFSWHLWGIIVLFIPFSAMVFFFLEEGSASDDFEWVGASGAMSVTSFKHNFLRSFWLAWSSTTGANSHTPSSRQGKIYSMFWTFFTLVIVASYTANLASFLTSSDNSFRIESWDDLRDTDVKACTKENTAYSAWLTENEPKIQQYKMAGSTNDFLSALYRGKCAAYVLPRATAQYITGSSTYCKDADSHFLEVGSPLDYGNQNMAAMVRADMWGVADALSRTITELTDDGTVASLYDEYIPTDAHCTVDTDDNGTLHLEDMAGLMLLTFCCSVGLVLWKTYEVYPYIVEVYNKGRSLEQFLVQYLIADQDAIDGFREVDTDGSGALSLDEIMKGAGVLGLKPEEAQKLYDGLEKDEEGEVQLEDFLNKFASHIKEEDEFTVLQQWDSSSDVRTAIYFPVYLFLLHRNRDKAEAWRNAHAVIFLDDEILDAIKHHQEDSLSVLLEGAGSGSSNSRIRTNTGYTRRMEFRRKLAWSSSSMAESLQKRPKIPSVSEMRKEERAQIVTAIAQEYIAKGMADAGDGLVTKKNSTSHRPNGAVKLRVEARSILSWCLKSIIDRDERNRAEISRTHIAINYETEEMIDATQHLQGRYDSEPNPLMRITRYSLRSRKLFMLPTRLAEYAINNLKPATFRGNADCVSFLQVLRRAHASMKHHESGESKTELSTGDKGFSQLILALFSHYSHMRNEFGVALCGHFELLFGIEPYEPTKHQAWIQYNSCLLDYILEFRATAKKEWDVLELCIRRSYESLEHRGHHAVFNQDLGEVTRSDFAWALVILEHYLTGLPMPEEGPAFRLAAMKYVNFARSLDEDALKVKDEMEKTDPLAVTKGFDENDVLFGATARRSRLSPMASGEAEQEHKNARQVSDAQSGRQTRARTSAPPSSRLASGLQVPQKGPTGQRGSGLQDPQKGKWNLSSPATPRQNFEVEVTTNPLRQASIPPPEKAVQIPESNNSTNNHENTSASADFSSSTTNSASGEPSADSLQSEPDERPKYWSANAPEEGEEEQAVDKNSTVDPEEDAGGGLLAHYLDDDQSGSDEDRDLFGDQGVSWRASTIRHQHNEVDDGEGEEITPRVGGSSWGGMSSVFNEPGFFG